ncbi:hypothetical protein C0J52_00265 [Blattella germanica]|nr:hypothetical protein C0J52_00265 [Blattella germanica]
MFLYALFLVSVLTASQAAGPQKRCQSPAIAPQRIEKVIADCQDELKLAILQVPPPVRLQEGQSGGQQSCDMAYDIFECISNKISEYCSGTN